MVSTTGNINPNARDERTKRRNWQRLNQMLTNSLLTLDSEGVLVIPDVETLTTSLTAGSVLFSDGTNIAQDNAKLFWDDTLNRLGIGTASPATILHVSGNVTFDGDLLVTTSGLHDLGITGKRFRMLYLSNDAHWNDNGKALFGGADDASMYYDGTNMIVNSMEIGTGAFVINHPEDAVSNEVLRLVGNNRATPADNDKAYVSMKLDNSVGTSTEYARLLWKARDVTNGTEDGEAILYVSRGGILKDMISARFFPSGVGDIIFNDTGLDVNFRVESNNNANMIFMDGGLDTLTIGSNSSLALLAADGQSDEVQLLAQGNGTQNADIFVVETSAGGNIFNVGQNKMGFYGTASIVQQTGVAVNAAGIHAALVNLGLITA